MKGMQKTRIQSGGCQIENSVTKDSCLASLKKACEAEHLPLWQNFQSNPHNH